jgi:hypothetical protein
MITVEWEGTDANGSVPFGRAVWDGEEFNTIDDTVKWALDILLEGVDRADASAVRQALLRAPAVFDGFYVRASVEEIAPEEAFVLHLSTDDNDANWLRNDETHKAEHEAFEARARMQAECEARDKKPENKDES